MIVSHMTYKDIKWILWLGASEHNSVLSRVLYQLNGSWWCSIGGGMLGTIWVSLSFHISLVLQLTSHITQALNENAFN